MRIWSWQHVSAIHCWVEPSLLLSSFSILYLLWFWHPIFCVLLHFCHLLFITQLLQYIFFSAFFCFIIFVSGIFVLIIFSFRLFLASFLFSICGFFSTFYATSFDIFRCDSISQHLPLSVSGSVGDSFRLEIAIASPNFGSLFICRERGLRAFWHVVLKIFARKQPLSGKF